MDVPQSTDPSPPEESSPTPEQAVKKVRMEGDQMDEDGTTIAHESAVAAQQQAANLQAGLFQFGAEEYDKRKVEHLNKQGEVSAVTFD